ncbi:magnesium/cobalt transporter CorA [Desulfopila inferna]|uniref:magnesium/cobalt transporter CorA n=1 Tax=Desulfopila inferna TaxID=468528 RepID=UPI001966125B|nr:magnesium/cobalt transporter CorA [Desulfopila inferna]MBM9603791.1 magnesium/cobalt transporter CorA [Desulfopila inferna]
MVRHLKRHAATKGDRPGRVVFVGQKKIEKPEFSIINYDRTELQEFKVGSIEECFPFRDKPVMSWINIDGLHDVSVIEKIGSHFGVHPLIREDIANTEQRPKLEIGDDYIFLSIKMLYPNEDENRIISEQFSFIFGENFVISFQERSGDVFDSVRARLRDTVPRVRFMTSDYLAYTLVDAIVDHYFVIMEHLAVTVEATEDDLIDDPSPDDLATIHDLKRQLILIRKATWPLREIISRLERTENPLIQQTTRLYIRDVYDHTVQVIDTVETFRDMVSGLLDIYLSSVSNKMNEVMKVLTIIATIFIPLGFLAGVYGMNFDTSSPYNMPELGMRYGYWLFWVLVVVVSMGLLLFFRRKRWL